MSSVREEVDSFHEFAIRRLGENESNASIDDLLSEWHDIRDRDAINQAIRDGLADVAAGRYESAEQSAEALRREFGFPRT
jgi:hypothetical protein